MVAEVHVPTVASDADGVGADSHFVTAGDERDPVISVVMPTLNEEEGIAECIRRATSAFEQIGLPGEIILSDSSSDQTPDIGRAMGAHVVEPDGTGYGYAYRYGFDQARGEYIVMGDADTTYDFEELPNLLDPIRNGDADICMGSRFEGEIKDGAMPTLHQFVGNPLLTAFLNLFYDTDISDAHSGFRVFHRDVLDVLDLHSDGMEFASEMVMDAGARGLTIEEVPITYHEREGEATLNSFQDGWRHIKFMLVNAPGYLFTVPGVVLMIAGLVMVGGSVSGVEFSIDGIIWPFGVRTMFAGSLLMIAGYQIAGLGAFATMASNPIRRPDDRVTNWIIDHMTMELGGTIGLAVFFPGVVYAGWILWVWYTAGYGALPGMRHDILAFTAIVVGLQTIFKSFFLSVLADR
ncbi:glycosyltransferase family 2 protein [Halorhabdus rudnickae]|uniref:glycosyltransferase family 2 protein n=1 Tax=Halorhabdus rudnickae TaxID=1775544 RepID=UPI0010848C5B|nr:glycosyltransferase family 2 protein [Halorhabdus rudnickae]